MHEILKFSFKSISALISSLLFIFYSVNAQPSRDLSGQALATAKKLESVMMMQTNPSHSSSPDNQHKLNRLTILGGFDGTQHSFFLNEIETYSDYARASGDLQDIQLANFFTDISKIYNPYEMISDDQTELALEYLETKRADPNWLIAHSASVLEAVLRGYQRDFTKAISLASNSLKIIPNDSSFDSDIARLYSYSVDVFLHGSMKNTDFFISSLDSLIDISMSVGFKFDGTVQLSNLVYSLRGLDDPETIRELSEILLRVSEEQPSDLPGLVEMRAARAFLRIGDYERALTLSRRGQTKTESSDILDVLKIAEIQSLAATGKVDLAESELGGLHIKPENAEIYKAKGLIAMAKGDAKATFENMDRHAELSIQRLLRSNNSDTSNLLANLENDKARQAEREAAREDMYLLEQEALTQRVNATQRGLAIMILLALAAGFMAAFMAYRSRTSLKLAQSAETALAGEQAKSQFLAVISHELRTPLNGIIGIADLLSLTAPSEDLRKKISIINESGQDLLSLVEQILDMSRIDANEMQVFPEAARMRDVISAVDTLWRPTIESKGVTFTAYVDPSVPDQLRMDPMRVKQCVNNLVSNAAKFTKHGRVHLHVTAITSPNDISTTLKVIVADTGMGIGQDVQSNLFRPFVQADSSITRQYGGSGLGLAISRSLARMMGGDMTVVSRLGAGSEFTLTIVAEQIEDVSLLDRMDEVFVDLDEQDKTETPAPAASSLALVSEASDGYQPQADAKPDGRRFSAPDEEYTPNFDDLRGVRVLIVEDSISNQDVMKTFLEPEGCEIMCTNNGIEALEGVKAQDFDVILMDIRMPEMDGIEATRLIRGQKQRNSSVPIIALTADATPETNAQCMAAGANIFLTKPVIATELYDSIRFVRRQAYNRMEVQREEKIAAKNPTQVSI